MLQLVDMHAHFIPAFFLDEVRRHPGRWGAHFEVRDGVPWIRQDVGYAYPCPPVFHDPSAMVDTMNHLGLDVRLLSVAPPLFNYWADRTSCVAFARECNDAAAGLVRANPARLAAMAHLPLPHAAESVRELERAQELGLTGCELGVGELNLDEPELRPVLRCAAELGVPLFLHPYHVGAKPELERYYFVNSIGNPFATLIAAARLIHAGILEELPCLRVVLAHGGGFLPYQRGRLEHAWRVHPAPRQHAPRPPSAYLGCFYYDSITFSSAALRFLIEQEGSERVMLGSDAPFAMGTDDPVAEVRSLDCRDSVLKGLLGGNAVRLFGLRGGTAPQREP